MHFYKKMLLVLFMCRHIFWLSIHPDYIFLMYFARCQLTVSIMLLLILGPKVRIHVCKCTYIVGITTMTD